MPQEPQAFDKYPASTVLLVNLIYIIVAAVGVYLVWQLGALWGFLFIIYVLANEFFIYYHGCSCCYYYGKRCAFGRGKIAPLLVTKDDPQKFCQRQVTWKNLMPVVLGTTIPVVVGIILLIQDFNWLILVLVLIPVLNWFVINPLIFGKLICLHCQQGRLCCPANDFFGKKAKSSQSPKV